MGLSRNSVGLNTIDAGLQIKKKKEDDIIVAFAGNPNVGKSTIFNALTGMNQHTGNWTGKTVTSACGYCTHGNQGYVMIDLPGCYSLEAHSKEEEVAGEFIDSGVADVIVIICDAVCLERNLNLVLQIINRTPDVVVCLNLMDEAAKKQIQINREELEKLLKVPVITTAARNGVGLDKIYRAVYNVIKDKENVFSPKEAGQSEKMPAEYFIKRAEDICQKVVYFEKEDYAEPDRKKDRLFTGKYTGFPIMFLVLMGIFWLTIIGANYPSQLLQKILFGVEDKLMQVCVWVGLPDFLSNMFVYGMYRVTAWVVSVMLPPMAIFFPLFTLMEDSGYLPRVAFNMDKCFQKCHACGKQSLTMCMGFGCNAAGVIGCRIIDSPRERLIAIITNSFVPCNGRFPTLIVMITMFFVGSAAGIKETIGEAAFLAAFIVIGIGATFLISRLLSATLLKGETSSFILELPPYRRPQIGKVIIRSVFDRTIFVLGRAVAAAAPAGILIWLLANLEINDATMLSHMSYYLDPFARIIGLDGVILLAFILGFPANEIVIPIIIMTYMSQGNLQQMNEVHMIKELFVANGWTWATAVSVMLFSLMHWPCATTCLTIRKETGSVKWTVLSILIPSIAGILVCAVFHYVIMLF